MLLLVFFLSKVLSFLLRSFQEALPLTNVFTGRLLNPCALLARESIPVESVM